MPFTKTATQQYGWVLLDQGLDLLNWKTGKYTNYKHDPADINSISSNDHWSGAKGRGK